MPNNAYDFWSPWSDPNAQFGQRGIASGPNNPMGGNYSAPGPNYQAPGGDTGIAQQALNQQQQDQEAQRAQQQAFIAALFGQQQAANAANEKRLGELNSSSAKSATTLAGDYDQMQAQAQTDWGAILSGLQGSEDLGLAQNAEDAKQQQGSTMARMAASGLGGTTVLPTLEAGITRNKGMADLAVRNTAQQQRTGVQQSLAGVLQAILGQKSNAIEQTKVENRGINERVSQMSPDMSQYLSLIMGR